MIVLRISPCKQLRSVQVGVGLGLRQAPRAVSSCFVGMLADGDPECGDKLALCPYLVHKK